MTGKRITDNLDAMLGVLPNALVEKLMALDHSDELLEVIEDFPLSLGQWLHGRTPIH